MNNLYIEWETGHMNIYMDYFFPCSIKGFKKLLKIIELDWKHETELKVKLKAYFQNRISALVDLWKENSRKYYDFKQKAVDTKEKIDSFKHPNGLPLSKDELKQAKFDLKIYTTTYKKALSDTKKNKRFKEQFEKYLESL